MHVRWLKSHSLVLKSYFLISHIILFIVYVDSILTQISGDDQFIYCGTTTGDIMKINMRTRLLTTCGPVKVKYSMVGEISSVIFDLSPYVLTYFNQYRTVSQKPHWQEMPLDTGAINRMCQFHLVWQSLSGDLTGSKTASGLLDLIGTEPWLVSFGKSVLSQLFLARMAAMKKVYLSWVCEKRCVLVFCAGCYCPQDTEEWELACWVWMWHLHTMLCSQLPNSEVSCVTPSL